MVKAVTQTAPDVEIGWSRRRHASRRRSDGVRHSIITYHNRPHLVFILVTILLSANYNCILILLFPFLLTSFESSYTSLPLSIMHSSTSVYLPPNLYSSSMKYPHPPSIPLSIMHSPSSICLLRISIHPP